MYYHLHGRYDYVDYTGNTFYFSDVVKNIPLGTCAIRNARDYGQLSHFLEQSIHLLSVIAFQLGTIIVTYHTEHS